MNIKEYLLSGAVNLAELASEMYPNNKTARVYLFKKLHGKSNRTFTKKDAEKALEIIKKRCETISSLTID